MLPRLTRQNLRGVWAALIVPWKDDDTLDEARWSREVRGYAGTGVHGVYTGGTTGEFYAQDDATFAKITQIVCREAHAIGIPVQIGVTSLSTRTTILRIREAVACGADALQIALPFWLELKDDEVLAFMDGIVAAAGATPIVLYLTMRSKRKLSPAFQGQIAKKYPTFIGTKDTGCDLPTLKAMLAEAPDLAIFGGDHDLIEKVPAGGKGGYCSITGINARAVVRCYEMVAAGRLDEARPLATKLHRYMMEAVLPLVRDDGLMDSAADRVQRVAGGGDVGLRCQGPYRSGTPAMVEKLKTWCREHAPELLQG
ncbi:MAG: dihydrodipicolinate synthase family protein [Planctomycetota bacterium]|nr:dihydrodipicolinate synthase family protein [Planctomycetota bacterium]